MVLQIFRNQLGAGIAAGRRSRLNRISIHRMASDVSAEYLATLRRMTGEQKLKAAAALYWSARKIKAAGLRRQHPDWHEEQIQQKVKEIFMYAVT